MYSKNCHYPIIYRNLHDKYLTGKSDLPQYKILFQLR